MELERLRAVWHEHLAQPPGRSDVDLVTRIVEQFARDLDRTIFRRDVVEISASLVIVACFGPGIVMMPSYMGKAGCLIVVAGAFIIIGTLWRARRSGRRPAESLALAEFFAAEKAGLLRQIQLLKNVAWWYLSPILLGANLFYWSLSKSRLGSVGYLVVTLVFGLFVWWLNQRAIRLQLQPMVDEIDGVIRRLTSEDPTDGETA